MIGRRSRLSILLAITLILSNIPWLVVAGEGIPHFADLRNGSFEEWTDDIPDYWNGSITNIPLSELPGILTVLIPAALPFSSSIPQYRTALYHPGLPDLFRWNIPSPIG